jgi:hypothetical protein
MKNIFKVLNYYSSSDLETVSSAVKSIPEWYKSIPKFVEWKDKKVPTIKGCSPFFDSLSSGYMYTLPCDIEFYWDGERPKAKALDNNFDNFVFERSPLVGDQYMPVFGYYLEHFHFYPMVGVSLPEGYSALYTHPLNRMDLPFTTTSGIIDNDKFSLPGQIPFFLKMGYQGVVKKGTPFLQVIPIKRKNWQMEWVDLSHEESNKIFADSTKIYRESGHSKYRTKDWQRKVY